MLQFFVFISRNETTHIASFLFSDSCYSAAQTAKISLLTLTVALRDNHLFECALQLPTFCLQCSLMHRQASRSYR